MSKEISIYDEAMKIFKGTDTNRTQEEMLAIDNLFDVVKEEYLLLLSEDENDKIIKALERAKKVEEFIINTFIECDEFGMEPTIPTHENGQEIVTRWRKELEELK